MKVKTDKKKIKIEFLFFVKFLNRERDVIKLSAAFNCIFDMLDVNVKNINSLQLAANSKSYCIVLYIMWV